MAEIAHQLWNISLPVRRHAIRKCCCLSSSTATGRRVWFNSIQRREHCWIYAFTDFDDYCGVHHYGTLTSRGVTACEELNSCSLLLFHPIHSYCSHCYFVYCFQGTIVVVGCCICCTFTASRLKYRSSLFSWSWSVSWVNLHCLSEKKFKTLYQIIVNFRVER